LISAFLRGTAASMVISDLAGLGYTFISEAFFPLALSARDVTLQHEMPPTDTVTTSQAVQHITLQCD
jgi:hypothetical protein